MKSRLAIFAVTGTAIAFGCTRNKTTDQSMQGESSTSSLALLDSSNAPAKRGRTAAVISAADAPVSSEIVSCIEQSLSASGYSVMAGLDSDVIVICRSVPPRDRDQSAAAGTPYYDRSTSLIAEDTLVRIPPRWVPTRPPSRWLATVEMQYATGIDNKAAVTEALSRIDVLIGTEGLGPAFSRADLSELWSALEKCAAGSTR